MKSLRDSKMKILHKANGWYYIVLSEAKWQSNTGDKRLRNANIQIHQFDRLPGFAILGLNRNHQNQNWSID